MELKEALITRRSVRKFTDYEVTSDEIIEILEAARHAPSWANTQIWDFIVVRDKELISKVTDTYSSSNPARKCSESASALIVVCAQKNVAGFKEGAPSTKFNEWFMFDIGTTVHNIALTAHNIGLGSVIVGSMDHNKCAEILKVPNTHEVVVVLPIGKPAYNVMEKSGPSRKELKECAYLNKFGEVYGL